MPILTVLIVMIAAGVLMLAVNNYVPMDAGIKRLFNIVVIVVLVVWLLQLFGIFDALRGVSVPRV